MSSSFPTSAHCNVLHLAQSDVEGGAGKAAFRLHSALRSIGVASTFHPGRDLRGDADVVPARSPESGIKATRRIAFANALALRAYPSRRRSELFSPSIFSYGRLDPLLVAKADIVCLHWIAGAFLRPTQLVGIGKPIVWRLSDLWPFTGGCHYPGVCRRFEAACGTCPTLGSQWEQDLSRLGMRQRARSYADLDLTIVAPSRWIAEQARRSSLFRGRRILHIPTGIELDVFRPRDRLHSRRQFGLPQDGSILLFGALGALGDARKGFADFIRATETWVATFNRKPAALAVFGGGGMPPQEVAGLPVYDLGRIDDRDKLAELYSAADALIAPFAEDNLPNVVIEAIACGTPVAAYAAGGIPEAVIEGISGAFAPPGQPDALADAIERAIARREFLAQGARAFAERTFDLKICAASYARLFADLASRSID